MTLSAADLRSLFADLNAELKHKGVRGEVHITGGAAMLLAYGSDLMTGDVDAQFAPDGPVIDAIHAIASRRGIQQTWLNNQASVYFSKHAPVGKTVFEDSHLQVMVTPPDLTATTCYC